MSVSSTSGLHLSSASTSCLMSFSDNMISSSYKLNSDDSPTNDALDHPQLYLVINDALPWQHIERVLRRHCFLLAPTSCTFIKSNCSVAASSRMRVSGPTNTGLDQPANGGSLGCREGTLVARM